MLAFIIHQPGLSDLPESSPKGALKQLSSAELLEDALALAVARGVVMYPTPRTKREASVVPLTLLPSPVAADCFHLAEKLTWLGGGPSPSSV